MVRTFKNEVVKLNPIHDDICAMTSRSSDIATRLPRFESKKLSGMLNQNAQFIEICKFMESLAPKIEESHRILKQLVQK